MSQTAIDAVVNTTKFVDSVTSMFTENKVTVGVVSIAMALGAHGLYSAFTHKEQINIVDKQIINDGAKFSRFMVITNNGKWFEIPASWYHWQWNVPEMWSSINKGSYVVTYYGWRSPVLGMYPGIIELNKTELD